MNRIHHWYRLGNSRVWKENGNYDWRMLPIAVLVWLVLVVMWQWVSPYRTNHLNIVLAVILCVICGVVLVAVSVGFVIAANRRSNDVVCTVLLYCSVIAITMLCFYVHTYVIAIDGTYRMVKIETPETSIPVTVRGLVEHMPLAAHGHNAQCKYVIHVSAISQGVSDKKREYVISQNPNSNLSMRVQGKGGWCQVQQQEVIVLQGVLSRADWGQVPYLLQPIGVGRSHRQASLPCHHEKCQCSDNSDNNDADTTMRRKSCQKNHNATIAYRVSPAPWIYRIIHRMQIAFFEQTRQLDVQGQILVPGLTLGVVGHDVLLEEPLVDNESRNKKEQSRAHSTQQAIMHTDRTRCAQLWNCNNHLHRQPMSSCSVQRSSLLPCAYTGDVTFQRNDYVERAGNNLTNAFKNAGIMHIMAVSGGHFVLIIMAIRRLCAHCRCSLRIACCFQLLGIAVLTMLMFPSDSVLRAVAMGVMALLGQYWHTTTQTINVLSWIVIGNVLLFPDLAMSIGFALSCGAVCGIAVLYRRLSRWFSRRMPMLIAAPLSMTLAAQILTLPIQLIYSPSLPLLSIVCNVCISPFVDLATVLGLIGLIIAPWWSWAAAWCVWCASLATNVMAHIAYWSTSRYAVLTVGSGGGVAVMVMLLEVMLCIAVLIVLRKYHYLKSLQTMLRKTVPVSIHVAHILEELQYYRYPPIGYSGIWGKSMYQWQSITNSQLSLAISVASLRLLQYKEWTLWCWWSKCSFHRYLLHIWIRLNCSAKNSLCSNIYNGQILQLMNNCKEQEGASDYAHITANNDIYDMGIMALPYYVQYYAEKTWNRNSTYYEQLQEWIKETYGMLRAL